MSEKAFPVHALDKKLDEIAWVLLKSDAMSALARAMEVKGISVDTSTLSRARRLGELTGALEQKLSTFANFDCKDRAWFDPAVPAHDRSLSADEYYGKDTPAAFRRLLLTSNGFVTRMRRRILPMAPRHRDSAFTTFLVESSGQVVDEGEPIELLIRFVFQPGYGEGFSYGFNTIHMRFKKPRNSQIHFTHLVAEIEPLPVGDAKLSVVGGSRDPIWTLYKEHSMLRGEYRYLDPFALVNGIEPGEEYIAEFIVEKAHGTIVDRNGKPLEDAAQRAVLGVLCSLELEDDRPREGWVTLGTQPLKVVRGDLE